MIVPALVLLCLSQSNANDWSGFPSSTPSKTEPKKDAKPSEPATAPAAAPTTPASAAPAAQPPPNVSNEARAKYQTARDLVSRGQPGKATEILNALAADYPRWAPIFATRCAAQAGLRYPQYAVEDCKYALSLDPNSVTTLYWLADSEAVLGRSTQAAAHFRQYAASNSPEVTTSYRELASKRANELDPNGAAAAPPPAAAAAPPPTNGNPLDAPVPPPPSAGGSKTASAPPPTTTPAPSGPAPAPGTCRSAVDCANGQDCKDRGDRQFVCMGNGRNGAFCANTKDCVYGTACKGRGDGVNVCMGSGGQNSFCDTSSDCSGGLWCQERKDHLKVCTPR